MSIDIHHLSKRFGNFQALHPLDLQIRSGELLALLGPSGCGKTTLLRLIAGLEAPDQGQIQFEGQDVTNLPARERNVGFVFQHYALFQHMSVFENVAFGLRVRPRRTRPNETQIRESVQEVLERVQLSTLAKRLPEQLSGGQRQRVALARALVIKPRVLLLDEPFGALDAQVRRELRRWLRQLHDDLKVTSVFVTHDQEEALDVADRIVVLRQGHVEQLGSATDLYERPSNAFVCGFLGEVNQFEGVADAGGVQIGELLWPNPSEVRGKARICVRPQDIELSAAASVQPTKNQQGLGALILDIRSYAGRARLELKPQFSQSPVHADAILHVELPAEHELLASLHKGQSVQLSPRRYAVFATD